MSNSPPESFAGDVPKGAVRSLAVIDIGTASIRLAIGEVSSAGEVRTRDTLSQAVNLGRDTFTRGSITRATIEDCVRILKSYQRVLKEYNIHGPDQIRVIGTSAVREASNRLAFIDRLYIATGLEVEPLDEAVVSRVTYLGMRRHLEERRRVSSARTLILEVGGGSTELLAVKGGDVIFAHVYRLGSLRLRKTLEEYRAPVVKLRDMMETQILRTVDEILEHIDLSDGPMDMIAMGGDMRFAAHELVDNWDLQELARITVPQLQKLTDRVLGMTEDQLVRRYDLAIMEAESLGPALLANLLLARAMDLGEIFVTNSTLRDGLLREMALRTSWTAEFSQQIIRSAIDLGKRYDFDEAHAIHAANLARNLFEQLRGEHRLDARYGIILYVAALLHEIGMFVSTRSHHKHALYLIRNSEMFGLGRKEHLLVALVARYHRRSSPLPTHEGYESLDRQERVAVTQLAAMLRLAIALDESRSQRIHEFTCNVEEGRLVISVPLVEDLSLEQLALRQHGGLFEESFGMPVLLRMQT